jgi:hypothetical protein
MPLVNQAPIVVALVSSIVLLLKVPVRLFPLIALLATGLEALRDFGLLKIPVPYAAAILGGLMVVGAVGSWIKSSARAPVTAATLVALVGLQLVLARLH